MNETTRIGISFEDVTLEIEGREAFVKSEWEKIKEHLWPYLRTKLGKEVSLRPKLTKLTEFYQAKRPHGHLKTVTLFGYYLKHFEGRQEFSQADLRCCYDALKLSLPKVLGQSIRDVRSRYKYFDKGSKRGYYKISSLGEKFVETQLPK
jgi:hypothetical protein